MEQYKKFGLSDVLMLIAVLLWSINFSFVKVALSEFTPLGFNGLRLLFASLLLVFFVIVSRENFRITKTDFWKLLRQPRTRPSLSQQLLYLLPC
jgi:drug/metabolite transporter (DMT)-like permease